MWGGPPYRRVAPHRQNSKERAYGRDRRRMRFFVDRRVIRQVNLWSRLNKGFTPMPVVLRPVGTSGRNSAGGRRYCTRLVQTYQTWAERRSHCDVLIGP